MFGLKTLGLGKDSSKNKTSSSNVTTTSLAPELNAGLWGNVNDTQALRDAYQPYTGALVADFRPDQIAAQQGARDIYNGQIGDAETREAIGLARTGATTAPPTISAGMVGNADLSKYEDPYVGRVLGGVADDLRRSMQLENLQSAALATKAGAFGGTGAAVAQSLNNDNFMRNLGQQSNQIRSQAFQSARGAAADDYARQLTADQANQNAVLQGARLNLDGAGVLGQLGSQRLDQASRRLGLLDASGNAQQAYYQRGLDAGHSQYLEQNQQQLALQQAIGQALGLIPNYGQTTQLGQSTSKSKNYNAQANFAWP